MENVMEPDGGFVVDVRPLPGVPGQPGLAFALDQAPVDGSDMMLLGNGQNGVKGAAGAARHVLRAEDGAMDLLELRDHVLPRLRENNELLEAARNEPSGGPGWREGLGSLSQVGRSLFDALVALEFSVKDSHEDGYAQQLEPALGKLAVDIRTGFHHVAGCIHNWRFDVPPQGLNLEEDIVQLENRMNAARPTGIAFSQSEILRAYAVQLHLKQIARLLRASRVETSRATGQVKE